MFCDVVGSEEEADSDDDIKASKKNLMEAERAVREHAHSGWRFMYGFTGYNCTKYHRLRS